MEVVNTPPTVAFTVSPTTGDANSTSHLHASPSSDPEDPVTALPIRWDYDNDLTYDTAWLTPKTARVGYSALRTYTTRLQARDPGGLTHSASRQSLCNDCDSHTCPLCSSSSSGP